MATKRKLFAAGTRALLLGVLVGAIALAGCGGGASEEDVAALETRVVELEQELETLAAETDSLRALERRLDSVQAFIDDAAGRLDGFQEFVDQARERLNDLDEVRQLIEQLAGLVGGG